jgi:hypothetical protein
MTFSELPKLQIIHSPYKPVYDHKAVPIAMLQNVDQLKKKITWKTELKKLELGNYN